MTRFAPRSGADADGYKIMCQWFGNQTKAAQANRNPREYDFQHFLKFLEHALVADQKPSIDAPVNGMKNLPSRCFTCVSR